MSDRPPIKITTEGTPEEHAHARAIGRAFAAGQRSRQPSTRPAEPLPELLERIAVEEGQHGPSMVRRLREAGYRIEGHGGGMATRPAEPRTDAGQGHLAASILLGADPELIARVICMIEDQAEAAALSVAPAHLVDALAFALARADLPTDTETSREYAKRLAPLVTQSGWLSESPAGLDVERLADAVDRAIDAATEDGPDLSDLIAAEYAHLRQGTDE